MMLLIASFAALLVGPAIVTIAQRRGTLLAGVDGVIAVAVCALVCLHVLPHAVTHVGPVALLVAVVGFALPALFERSFFGGPRAALDARPRDPGSPLEALETPRAGRSRASRALVLVALVGLGLHALVDGAALRVGGSLLGAGVVLHRVTLALLIWRIARPRFGLTTALALLAVVGVATAVGFAASGAGLHLHVHADGLALLQAFVGGSIAHIALGHARPAVRHLAGLAR